MVFDFFRRRRRAERAEVGIDPVKLANLLPFEAKILGDRGKYIVQFKLEPGDRWIENILLVDGNTVFFSHEPESAKVRFLAEDLNIPLEYRFSVDSVWDLIIHLSKVYERLRKLYAREGNSFLYGAVEKVQTLLEELRKEGKPDICAKIFAELEKIRSEDPDRYTTLRKKLLKECDRIVASFDGGCIQEG